MVEQPPQTQKNIEDARKCFDAFAAYWNQFSICLLKEKDVIKSDREKAANNIALALANVILINDALSRAGIKGDDIVLEGIKENQQQGVLDCKLPEIKTDKLVIPAGSIANAGDWWAEKFKNAPNNELQKDLSKFWLEKLLGTTQVIDKLITIRSLVNPRLKLKIEEKRNVFLQVMKETFGLEMPKIGQTPS